MSANLLQVLKAFKSYGPRSLFSDAEFAVNSGEHLGVIGPNGAGKSTLFKVLTGQEELDSGEIVRSRELRLGYLSQHENFEPGETGEEYLLKKAKIPIWELKSRGRALQLTEKNLSVPILSLSGGYRMRIKLLALLGEDPNLMLLDEPTNYLDLETTLILEKFLQSYEGAFLLISHDREFLRRTTDHTLEVEDGSITKFNGNIDDYFEQKEMLAEQLRAAAANQAEKRKSVLDFVARFGAKATKAKQAQSRLRRLEKMEVIEIKPILATAKIRIPPPHATGKYIITASEAEFGYVTAGVSRTILSDVNVTIERGDHLAIVGLNGAGKSTLLKGLTGNLDPLSGSVKQGHNVEIAFYNQHVVEALDPKDTVLESLLAVADPALPQQDVLDLAGSLLFAGDDVRKKISVLSGGECSRVALGRVLLTKSPCLVLDEPTNHLDFQSVEALTLALQKFEGTVIVVSHDRGFIRRVGTKILEVSSGALKLYPGTYDEYVWSLQNSLQAEEDSASGGSGSSGSGGASRGNSASGGGSCSGTSASGSTDAGDGKPALTGAEAYALKKENEKRVRALERTVAKLETEMAKLRTEVDALNEKLSAGETDRKNIDAISEKSTRLNTLEEEWLEASSELEGLR